MCHTQKNINKSTNKICFSNIAAHTKVDKIQKMNKEKQMSEGAVIRFLRKERKMTLEQLADAMGGYDPGNLSKFERGLQEMGPQNLSAAAKALGVKKIDIHYMADFGIQPQNIKKIESNAEFIGDLEPWDSSTALGEDEVELPYFTEVELAAGNGISQVRENHGPKLRFSRSTLRSRGVSPHNAACVKVSGASMEPVLPDGSTVGVDTSKTKIIDGKMFAIDHDGMLRVKTLYKIPGGVRFRSFNQAEYPDETYTGDDLRHIRIIGQVFWYSVLLT